jgi:molybdopterin molybdotransferase
MLTYDEALQKVLSTVPVLPTEDVELESLCDRFLAQPLKAAFDLPRFDNSAVDGFGVLPDDIRDASEDKPVELSLVGTIQAGDSGDVAALKKGETIKILTGATVPPSVEAVVMREFCDEQNGKVAFKTSASASENIRRRGDEVKQGQEVLPAGIRVSPPIVGMIASFGHERFPVYQQPRVIVVVTGDELVKPGGSLGDGQIFESNSFALAAAVKALGLPKCNTIHARDDRQATKDAFARAIEQADVIISAGGVSVGEHDYVKVALEEDLQVKTVFWRIAIKPGKPVYFGFIDRKIEGEDETRRKVIFGLPGNPVSALVTFNLFVKPALRRMQGDFEPAAAPWSANLESDLKKKPGRMDFVRGILSCSPAGVLNVLPTRGQDSHMLSGLAKANCLIRFPADSERITKAQCIRLERLDWHS